MEQYGPKTRYFASKIYDMAKAGVSGWDFTQLVSLNEDLFTRLDRYLIAHKIKLTGAPRGLPELDAARRDYWKAEFLRIAGSRFDDSTLNRWVPSVIVGYDGSMTYATKAQEPSHGEKLNMFRFASVFGVAFKEKFGFDETEGLLKKVFRVRPFNLKNFEELIFYFCIRKDPTDWYQAGEDLIFRLHRELFNEPSPVSDLKQAISEIKKHLHQPADTDPKLLKTADLMVHIDSIQDEKELLNFIKNHSSSFWGKANLYSARQRIIEMAEDAWEYAQEEHSLLEGNTVTQYEPTKIQASKLMNIITGLNLRATPPQQLDTTVLSHAILHNFPTYSKLNDVILEKDKKVTEETMRKLTILLAFYMYTYEHYQLPMLEAQVSCGNQSAMTEEDLAQVNVDNGFELSQGEVRCLGVDENGIKLVDYVLELSGFTQLYPYEFYDALFLFCFASGKPLDTFREILQKAAKNPKKEHYNGKKTDR